MLLRLEEFPKSVQEIFRRIGKGFYKSKLDEEISGDLDRTIANIIAVLLDGCNKIPEEYISQLLSNVQLANIQILSARWQYINDFLMNKPIEEMHDGFETLLSEIDESNLDRWIVRSILVDLRNIYARNYWDSEKSRTMIETIQAKIKFLGEGSYTPYLDREIVYAYNSLAKKLMDNWIDSPYTVHFGSNFPEAIEHLSKAFIVAIYTGSLTNIRIVREMIARFSYHYYKMLNHPPLLIGALKMLIVEGELSDVEKIIDTDWEQFFEHTIGDPKGMIEFPVSRCYAVENKVAKALLVKKWGPYFDSDYLKEIQEFLLDGIDAPWSFNANKDFKRKSLEALKPIINRVNTEFVLQKLMTMIEEHPLVFDEVINVLSAIDWEKISPEQAKKAVQIFYPLKNKAVRQSNLYEMLSLIIHSHQKAFDEFRQEMIDEWQTNHNLSLVILCSSSHGFLEHEEARSMASYIVELIDSQNKKATAGSAIGMGGVMLFRILARFINEYSLPPMDIIGSVYQEVLVNPYQVVNEKIECIDSIMMILGDDNDVEKVKWLESITVSPEEILQGRGDDLFEKYSAERLELKIDEWNLKTRVDCDLFKISIRCMKYGNHSFRDVREATLPVIDALLSICGETSNLGLWQYLYSKTFDVWPRIRGDALVIMAQNCCNREIQFPFLLERMSELVADNNSYVRSSIAYALKEYLGEEKEAAKEIADLLRKDAHYKIREQMIAYDKN